MSDVGRVDLVHVRRAVVVSEPSGQELDAHALGEPDLVLGDARHGGVEDEGGLVAGGGGKGYGVGAEHSLGGEGGDHAQAAGGHDESEHILAGGGHGVDAERAGVSGVYEGDVADADVSGLLDGEVHGVASEDDGESLVGIDDRGGGCLSKDAPLGVGLDAAVTVALDVDLDHVGDAVALDAPEVGCDEGLDGGIDVVGRLSHLGEDGRDRVRRRDSWGTRTWSWAGTLKRSSIFVFFVFV